MQPEVRDTSTGYEVSFTEEPGMPPYLTFKADFVERTAWGLLTTLSVQSPLAIQSPLPMSRLPPSIFSPLLCGRSCNSLRACTVPQA